MVLRSQSHGTGRRMNGMNGACFQDRSHVQQTQDNHNMQNDSFYQGEPEHVPGQDHHDDGFFNQDMHPGEECPVNEDGFFNQEDSFFGQDNDNYEENGVEQHDAYEVSA